MFTPSRDEVRKFFCMSWKKYQDKLPLQSAEVIAAGIVAQHPEYHLLLSNQDAALQEEWTPERGGMNPFLHLSLHLAIAEQLSIDQPPGIKAAFARLNQRMDTHDAEHVLLECLGEVLWAAQQHGGMPDNDSYLEKISQRI